MIGLRLQQLEDNINRNLELLYEYEVRLRYEDDPRRIARYRGEIERQREALTIYKNEYDELKNRVTTDPLTKTRDATDRLEQMNLKLNQMDFKLDELQKGQANVLKELLEMRQAVIVRFDISDQTIVSSVVKHLDKSQLSDVQIILDHIEANRVQRIEMDEALIAIQQALSETKRHPMDYADLQLANDAMTLSKLIDDPKIDSAHKLKVSIPIIPLILSYEGEVGLNVGMNLKEAWKHLRGK